jgi:hypothetical protein
MEMPKFSAAASLYVSSGRYRTGGHAPSLFGPMNRLRPALERGEVPPITVPGENIPIHSCPPGWTDLGGTCWPNPMTEPPSGGGNGSGTPGFPGEPSGGGPPGPGGGPPKPPKPPRPPRQEFKCRPWDYVCKAEAIINASKHAACEERIAQCVSDHCKGKAPSELGECEANCTDIAGEEEVCQSDPCFHGVPCTWTGEGWECYPIRGCPGWDWS